MCYTGKNMLFLEHTVTPLGPELQIAPDLPHFGVPEVHIDDFDDTLSNTPLALSGLLKVCGDLGFGNSINAQAIAEARQRAWERGGSYNVLELLGEHLDAPAIDQVRRHFRSGDGGYPMAFDDAADYQQRLRKNGFVPHFVMTYGEGMQAYPCGGWQRDKLERAASQGWWPTGFAYFMSHSSKGPEVHSLQNPATGDYDLVGVNDKGEPAAMFSAKRALLIDDRKTSLAGTTESCTPIYIRRPAVAPTPKQTEGELPAGARTVASLDEIRVSTAIRPLNSSAEAVSPAALRIAAFIPMRGLTSVGGPR
jgi:hypothetical protein